MSKKDSLISIIVPVYNINEYLSTCVKSILGQSYSNFEVILVDDGSTDGSGELCDKLAKDDKRIVVIHQKNQGTGAARNSGIRKANGEYIGFVDGDDFIDSRMYEYLIHAICDSNMILCSYRVVFSENEGDIIIDKSSETVYTYSSEEMLRMLLHREITDTVWKGLYKRDLCYNILFPEGKKYEDAFWLYKAIAYAKNIKYLKIPLYSYQQRETSLIHQKLDRTTFDYLEAKKVRNDYLQECFPTLYNLGKCELNSFCMEFQYRIEKISDFNQREEFKKILQVYIPECRLSLFEILQLDTKRTTRIWYLLSVLNFQFFSNLKFKLLKHV